MFRRQQDQIEIPAESSVLKAVVENGDVRPVGCRGFHPSTSISIGDHRDPGVPPPMEKHFILTIAAENERRSPSHSRQLRCQPSRERRFSRAPDSEVSDRNHGD
jgi:hypothetical protein